MTRLVVALVPVVAAVAVLPAVDRRAQELVRPVSAMEPAPMVRADPAPGHKWASSNSS
jgi:hypothetical protein